MVIAAMALAGGDIVVTRNVDDFRNPLPPTGFRTG
jgi:predicted nucleic acid-binding protein